MLPTPHIFSVERGTCKGRLSCLHICFIAMAIMHGEAAAAAAGHRHEARVRLNKQQEQMHMTSVGSVWSARMGTAGGGRRSCSLPPPVLTTTELSPHSSGSLFRSVLLFGSLLVKEAATSHWAPALNMTLTGHSHCACHLNTTELHTDTASDFILTGEAKAALPDSVNVRE